MVPALPLQPRLRTPVKPASALHPVHAAPCPQAYHLWLQNRDRAECGAGTAHAEAAALENARAHGIDPRGTTAVVTLEPCNHAGRTGPCSEALLAAGVRRVVFALADPNAAPVFDLKG